MGVRVTLCGGEGEESLCLQLVLRQSFSVKQEIGQRVLRYGIARIYSPLEPLDAAAKIVILSGVD